MTWRAARTLVLLVLPLTLLRTLPGTLSLALPGILGIGAAMAQPLDLSQGGPITVTAHDGLEWHQAEQEVIALGDARAVRQNVTVTADRLIAFYRKKAEPPAPGGTSTAGTPTQGAAAHGGAASQAPTTTATPVAADSGIAGDTDTAGTEIYRLRAEGNVQIFTATDHAQADLAVYDMDQAVLVLTGHDLRLTTPNDLLTARDTMEYWPQKHMAVARGNAVVITKDSRRIAADVLVAYTTDSSAQTPAGAAKPPPKPAAPATSPTGAATPARAASGDDLAQSGKLEKVDAIGHVSVRTPTDTATGERAVYVPDTGIARLAGNVRITRGQNQLDGQEAEVNMKTGIARLLRGETERVTGLVVPNDASNRDLSNVAQPTGGANPGANSAGGASGTANQPGTPAGKSSSGAPAAKPAGGHT